MRIIKLLISGITLIVACTSQAAIVSITVPGTSDMWLAGMPDGSTASSGDIAPNHSPVLVNGIDLNVGSLTFGNVSGGVSNGPGCPTNCSIPDGGSLFNHSPGALNGISGVRAPINALMGVFLGDSQPDSSAAPSTLDFGILGLDFASITPELKQVFFIGDGLTGIGGGASQEFSIPTGATQLYLGTMDGFGWFNNSGALNIDVSAISVPTISVPTISVPAVPVSAVPVPGAIWLFGSGLIGLAGIKKRKMNRK
ncbi:MAG: PEP-CTERM sorting domain-containing protein [Methylococcaceae bacterium]